MKKTAVSISSGLVKREGISIIRENSRLIAQFLFTAMFIGIGFWFLKHEKTEIQNIRNTLLTTDFNWLLIGLLLTATYIFLQGLMYYLSFRSVDSNIGIADAIILFLKRNFVSVFLPAGGVSSLVFFTRDIERRGISKSQIHFASSIYGFIGILSVVIIAIPAFIYSIFRGSIGTGEWLGFASIILLTFLAMYIFRSVTQKGWIYKTIIKVIPAAEAFLGELENYRIDNYKLIFTLFVSLIIEVAGICHLYIAMKALHFTPSILAAIMGYIIAVIFLIVSPFLRGLGAIEISMAFLLTRFGFNSVEAISITLLYRFFEFWTPMLAGIVSFLLKINKLLFRIIPAVLIFTLGIVNIISVLTPSIAWRIEHLKNFLFTDAIVFSNYFVLTAGLFLLVTAAFMLKGLQIAWWFALVLSIGSFIGHITKALDYEEATVALIVILNLLVTRKQYYIKTNPRLFYVGLQTSLLSVMAVMIYGTLGFYFLDKNHFNVDFGWTQSIWYTVKNFFLIGSPEISPADSFAKHFISSINISGFVSIGFLTYTLIKPYVLKNTSSPEEIEQAAELLNLHGKSALDYFKVSKDKLIFLPGDSNAFIAYRVSGNFAVVLENPVASDQDHLLQCIKDFDTYCYENGLKSIYYRVPEESLPAFKDCSKKYLFLGQEAVVDLDAFSLEGGHRRSLRNAVNKVTERGYKSQIHEPPIKDGLLQKLKSVSDEWLKVTDRSEIVFSQGMFDWNEMKMQTLITVENPEEKIVCFLNIIPDYTKSEGTYDLLRKTADAPNGVMDFILIQLFNYFRACNYRYVNLGFAPLSGLTNPQNITEKSMKFAYNKLRSFSHYKGMRDFKEKYTPVWYNKYLIYENDYDLFQVPSVLSKVIKP